MIITIRNDEDFVENVVLDIDSVPFEFDGNL